MTNKTNSNAPGPAIPGLPAGMSQEQLQKLIAAMQQQQLQAMPAYKRNFMKFLNFIGPRLQAMVQHIDRFINFVTLPSDKDRNDVVQAARGPILFGTYVAVVFFGFGGLWAAIAPLDSAQYATGTLMSSTHKKVIQHRDGGIIKAIYVKQGDHVKAGDPIIALDDTAAKAQYHSLLNQYRSYKAEESRLIAERDGLEHIVFSPKLLKDAEKPEVAKIFQTQKHVFESKRIYIKTLEKHSEKRIEQNTLQIEGLKEKKKATAKAFEVAEERLKAAKSLFAKNIMSRHALSEIEKLYAEAKSNDLTTDSEIMRLEQETSKIAVELHKEKSQIFTQALQELEKVQMNLGNVKQQLAKEKDILDRSIVVAPEDGVINSMQQITTIGGVIGQGTPIAEISPERDTLIVQARISPRFIGYVTVGQKAKMKFSAFKSRTTPTFSGTVVALSPDIVMDKNADPKSGENAYYEARIEIDMEEFNQDAKRLNLVLLPGMQAEVMIVTGTRTLLRYLLDPVTDNMFKAFKEK